MRLPISDQTNQLWNWVDNIDGWLSREEGELLYHLAKRSGTDTVIVEIGSWKGKSTICLASGSKTGCGAKVYAIDPHTGSCEHIQRASNGTVWTFHEFTQNIERAGVSDLVVARVQTSEEAAKDFASPVGLIFIDGAHEYDLAKLDFTLWFPKLKNGGIMAFHDTVGWEGPKRTVKEFIYKSRHFKNAGFVGSITFAEKVIQNSIYDRFRNRYILLLKDLFELLHESSVVRATAGYVKQMLRARSSR